MGYNVFIAAFVKFQTGWYGYSHPAETGHNGFVNGQPLVDCSGLVYAGLYDAGYRLPKINNANDFSPVDTVFNVKRFSHNRVGMADEF